jgi:hypothetical protein
MTKDEVLKATSTNELMRLYRLRYKPGEDVILVALSKDQAWVSYGYTREIIKEELNLRRF